ncbi:hypothetical protein G7Z17_g13534 [Cylindrodendrum hubeiense]|uniref:Uncharacterized protein n=1 Tax=Cylindrodendrum hubeiense TaxID=595255 RepID=A0A9P5L977_9HYPO|nr:hypothetical protein G7Z17_g13534 [Cylindrodendrum hubeiense]
MSNPASSPGQYPERFRDSVVSVASKVSKSMKQWLTSKDETPKGKLKETKLESIRAMAASPRPPRFPPTSQSPSATGRR